MNRRCAHASLLVVLVALVALLGGCGGVAWRDEVGAAHTRPTADELYRVAVTLADRGDLIRAEQYASLAVAEGLPLSRALPLLVSVCLRASRITAALAHAELGLRNRPDDMRLRYLVASMYAAIHRSDDAVAELERVLAVAPGHPRAAQLLNELRRERP